MGASRVTTFLSASLAQPNPELGRTGLWDSPPAIPPSQGSP